jgi:hypothetical protein
VITDILAAHKRSQSRKQAAVASQYALNHGHYPDGSVLFENWLGLLFRQEPFPLVNEVSDTPTRAPCQIAPCLVYYTPDGKPCLWVGVRIH